MKIVKGLAILSVAVSVCISGCLSNTPNDNLLKKNEVTSEGVNEKLTKDEASFFSKSGAVACATGAAVGLLACLNAKDKLACAIAAGAAGCAVAMTGNYVLDKVRANYKTTEEQLDATKELVEKDLNKTKNLHTGVQQTMKDDQAELAQLQKDIKAGKKTQADLDNKLAQMDKNMEFIRKNVDKAQEQLTAYKEASETLNKEAAQKGPNSIAAKKAQELNKTIADQEAELASLLNAAADYATSVDHVRKTKQIGA